MPIIPFSLSSCPVSSLYYHAGPLRLRPAVDVPPRVAESVGRCARSQHAPQCRECAPATIFLVPGQCPRPDVIR